MLGEANFNQRTTAVRTTGQGAERFPMEPLARPEFAENQKSALGTTLVTAMREWRE